MWWPDVHTSRKCVWFPEVFLKVICIAGVEWSMDYDASGVAVIVASEAHAITLAVEGLLGVVFTVATLTDEAIDAGEVKPVLTRQNFDTQYL